MGRGQLSATSQTRHEAMDASSWPKIGVARTFDEHRAGAVPVGVFSSKPLMRGLFLYQSRPPLRTWGLTPLRTWGLMSNPTQANRQVSRGPAIRTLTALSSLLHQDDGPILWRGPCTLVGVDVGAYDLFKDLEGLRRGETQENRRSTEEAKPRG